jgi:hypothetical protein
VKKYGCFTSDIAAMIREKIEKCQSEMLRNIDAVLLLNGDKYAALSFAEAKGAIVMAKEIIEELEAEDDAK